ncbi:MAG: helix-turn-helix domain-containing protein [Actinomycetales bacterium]|nr:helix-turn-helix domain-containing protein [Actinomycetales bacterium]
MSSQKRFLAVPDVAETLNVTVRQVRALLHSGELRGIQVGGRGIWRIEAQELEDYIARQYDRTATAVAEDHFTAQAPTSSQR